MGNTRKAGPQGTGFLLRILPYLQGDTLGKNWNWNAGISSVAVNPGPCTCRNHDVTATDIKGFYCPIRRSMPRESDRPLMLPAIVSVDLDSPYVTGGGAGGTDYGGCAGRHAAFSLPTGYNLCDATMHYEPEFVPAPITKANDTPDTRWGIFGRVNVSTKPSEILDGTSNTILTGELQRITDTMPTSKDGWVIGGPATLFTTGAMFRREGTTCSRSLRPATAR